MEQEHNKLGVTFLIILIVIFVVGGYFAMRYFTTEHEVKENTDVKETENNVDLRIDSSKDYIVYENAEEVLHDEHIEYIDASINVKGLESVNNTLKQEMNTIRKSIKYTKDLEEELSEDATENDEGIYSLDYREFKDYKYDNYLSLVVMDYTYDIVKTHQPKALKSYVVDINEGKVISEEELLTKYNVSLEDIKEKVKTRLNETMVNSANNVLVDETLKLENYTLYINNTGDLEISFVVKSTENNYNDSIVVS